MRPRTKFGRAVKWAYLMSWGRQGFSTLFALFLAAILGPQDYGIIAVAMIYIAFIQMLLDQGFLAALIQREDLQAEHLNTVFWLTLSSSLLLAFIGIELSHWWATANHSAVLVNVIGALSVCIVIEGMTVVQRALLQRFMDFRSLSLATAISVIVGGTVGIVMALRGYGVWALVGQQISKDFVALLAIWRLSSWRPGWRFSFVALRELFGFSSSNFIAKLGVFANTQADSIVLGLFFGPLAVGLYRLAERIMNSVLNLAAAPLQTVSFPQFSRLQGNSTELRQSILSCIRMSAVATIPAMAGLAITSNLVFALLGPKWVTAVDVLRILCLVGISISVWQFIGPLLQAMSQPHHLAILEWSQAFVGTALTVIVCFHLRNATDWWQIMGVATARLTISVAMLLVGLLFVLPRLSRISGKHVFAAVAPSLCSGAVVIGIVGSLPRFGWTHRLGPLPSLLVIVPFGALAGMVTLYALDKMVRRIVNDQLHNIFQSRKSTGSSPGDSLNSQPRNRINCEPSFQEASTQRRPKLSVIIPTFNRATLLEKAVQSIFQQTSSDYEIIIVDDGSTDRTEDTVARLVQDRCGLGERIRYLFQNNKGKSTALNFGLSETKGEWIAFLDSDDSWLPNKTQEQFNVLNQFMPDSGACFTNASFVNNPFLNSTAFECARRRFPGRMGILQNCTEFVVKPFGIFMQTVMVHSRVMKRVGDFDPTLRVIQDIDFIFRLALETQLCFVNEPLVLIDRTPSRSEGLIETLMSNEQNSLTEQQRMYERWLRLSRGLNMDVQQAIRAHLRSIHSEWANWFLRNKQYRKARHAISDAARAEFTPSLAAKWCLAAAAPALARMLILQRARLGHARVMFDAMGCSDAQERDPTRSEC